MNIDNLTYEELLDLNRKIVERLKLFDRMKSYSEMMNFRIGEKVKFDSSSGEEVVGTLVKYNKKTVTIITEIGERWNVSPRLLTKAETPETKIIEIKESKII